MVLATVIKVIGFLPLVLLTIAFIWAFFITGITSYGLGGAKIVFCDVGQGDAILFLDKNVQILIDGGPDDKVSRCLAQYMPWWDRQLELVVATHPDADHITGLVSVLTQYKVRSIWLSQQQATTEQFRDFSAAIEAARAKGVTVMYPTTGLQQVLTESTRVSVLWPPPETLLWDIFSIKSASELETNDGSIVLFLQCGKTSILLTGDAENKTETAMLKLGLLTKTDILKVGHHGSKSSSTQEFIAKISPEVGVISVGEKNRYGHPDETVLERLKADGVSLERTDQVGNIVTRCGT